MASPPPPPPPLQWLPLLLPPYLPQRLAWPRMSNQKTCPGVVCGVSVDLA
eukprot:m.152341 g.152341  ORF g.152341 m.152341 type:complete len:50 (-) comp17437_c0_seq1:262-411(-)